ncbi:hypothetical protein HUJ05_006841 [Dendroctonus ponderosae]|nr:hypothetical protein HUJ05_006841 [Dendroctonus ponderosae]
MKLDTGSSLPISTGSSLILHDSRFSLRYDPASSTYVLQIKDMQETDAGTYACQILISPSNRVSAEVQVQVRRPPFISDNSTRSVVVAEGSGGSISRGNTLKIKGIKKEDRGTYYCIAENGVGQGARRNIAVEVEFAPVVTVPRPRLGQALQYDMDLECHVEAYPLPAITWEKDDITLVNNQHNMISHFAVADEFTDTTLRVITIEKRQYGQYVCKAANRLESIIPVCPPACGSTRYGDASTLSTSTVALFFTLLICIYRNFTAQR